jgi:hypothetical protein
MSSDQSDWKTAGRLKDGARLSFDAAFIGGSLAVGAMLFIMLLTFKGLFPMAH